MVINRKPMFVSEQALMRLQDLAKEYRCFTGDVVDILTGVKTKEQVENDFQKENKKHLARRAGRVMDNRVDVG